jgi:hypothetical protein
MARVIVERPVSARLSISHPNRGALDVGPRPATVEQTSLRPGVKSAARVPDDFFGEHLGSPARDSVRSPLKIAGTLTAALLVGACLAAPAGYAAAQPTAPSASGGASVGTSDGATTDLLPTAVSLAAPPAANVPVGARFTLKGTVSGDAGRTAALELSTPTGWRPLAQATTDADGAYALPLPTDWLYRGSLRLRVPATDADDAATSATFGTALVPSYDPQGAARDWGLTVPGVRWDPCAGPISYKVNEAGVSDRRLAQLRQALRLVHEASGLEFSYAGTTTAVPYRTDGSSRTRSDAAFTIAFATGRQVRQFRTDVVGLGGFVWRGNAIVHGLVSLDKGARLKDSFGLGQTWGTLMLHELGHALGLAHAGGREQVMHSGINSKSRGSYQAGDLTGLRREGAVGGCLPSTSARAAAPQVVVSR